MTPRNLQQDEHQGIPELLMQFGKQVLIFVSLSFYSIFLLMFLLSLTKISPSSDL